MEHSTEDLELKFDLELIRESLFSADETIREKTLTWLNQSVAFSKETKRDAKDKLFAEVDLKPYCDLLFEYRKKYRYLLSQEFYEAYETYSNLAVSQYLIKLTSQYGQMNLENNLTILLELYERHRTKIKASQKIKLLKTLLNKILTDDDFAKPGKLTFENMALLMRLYRLSADLVMEYWQTTIEAAKQAEQDRKEREKASSKSEPKTEAEQKLANWPFFDAEDRKNWLRNISKFINSWKDDEQNYPAIAAGLQAVKAVLCNLPDSSGIKDMAKGAADDIGLPFTPIGVIWVLVREGYSCAKSYPYGWYVDLYNLQQRIRLVKHAIDEEDAEKELLELQKDLYACRNNTDWSVIYNVLDSLADLAEHHPNIELRRQIILGDQEHPGLCYFLSYPFGFKDHKGKSHKLIKELFERLAQDKDLEMMKCLAEALSQEIDKRSYLVKEKETGLLKAWQFIKQLESPFASARFIEGKEQTIKAVETKFLTENFRIASALIEESKFEEARERFLGGLLLEDEELYQIYFINHKEFPLELSKLFANLAATTKPEFPEQRLNYKLCQAFLIFSSSWPENLNSSQLQQLLKNNDWRQSLNLVCETLLQLYQARFELSKRISEKQLMEQHQQGLTIIKELGQLLGSPEVKNFTQQDKQIFYMQLKRYLLTDELEQIFTEGILEGLKSQEVDIAGDKTELEEKGKEEESDTEPKASEEAKKKVIISEEQQMELLRFDPLSTWKQQLSLLRVYQLPKDEIEEETKTKKKGQRTAAIKKERNTVKIYRINDAYKLVQEELKPEVAKEFWSFTDHEEDGKQHEAHQIRNDNYPSLSPVSQSSLCGLYAKGDPRCPAEEYKARSLWHHISGERRPIELVVMQEETSKPVRLVQLSPTIKTNRGHDTRVKENGQTIVKQSDGTLRDYELSEERIPNLDTDHFSLLFLHTLMSNPGDGKADNYLCEVYKEGGQEKKRLVCIDNEEIFCSPVRERTWKDQDRAYKGYVLQVKTMLYCLKEMEDELSPKAIERFLSLNPAAVLREWIMDCADYDRRYADLLTEDGKKAYEERAEKKYTTGDEDKKAQEESEGSHPHFDMRFKAGLLTACYETMHRIQELLREAQTKGRKLTHMELLKEVEPFLGEVYGTAYKQYNTPKERFDAVSKGLYDKVGITESFSVIPGQKVEGPEQEAEDRTEAIAATIARSQRSHQKSVSVTGSLRLLSSRGIKTGQDGAKKGASNTEIPLRPLSIDTGKESEPSKSVPSMPIDAMSELERTVAEHQQIKEIQRILRWGSREQIAACLNRFLGIPKTGTKSAVKKTKIQAEQSPFVQDYTDWFREQVIEAINFSEIEEKQQAAIIAGLIQSLSRDSLDITIKHLNLRGCKVLTDKDLGALTRKLPELKWLDISDCKNISHDGLQAVFKNCLHLKHLEANNLPNLKKLILKHIPPKTVGEEKSKGGSLASISCNGCQNLEEVVLELPQLQSLRLRNANKLHHLDVINETLAKIKLTGCDNLKHRETLEKYPFLCLQELPINKLPEQVIKELEMALDEVFENRKLTVKNLSLTQRKSLVANINKWTSRLSFMLNDLIKTEKTLTAKISKAVGTNKIELDTIDNYCSIIKILFESGALDPARTDQILQNLFAELYALVAIEIDDSQPANWYKKLTHKTELIEKLSNLIEKLEQSHVELVNIRLLDKFESSEAKDASIQVLDSFAAVNMTIKQDQRFIEKMITGLINGLKDDGTRDTCIHVLNRFSHVIIKLDPKQIERVINKLTDGLKDKNSNISNACAQALSHCKNVISNLSQDSIKQVITALLQGLTRDDREIDKICAYTLENLAEVINNLTPDNMEPIIDLLIEGLRDKNIAIINKFAQVIDGFRKVITQLDQRKIKEIIDKLIIGLESKDGDVINVYTKILSNFGEVFSKLNQNEIKNIIFSLIHDLKNTGNNIYVQALDAIKHAIRKLDRASINEIINKLFEGLNDKNYQIQKSDIQVLVIFEKEIDQDLINEIINKLLDDIEDKEYKIQSRSVQALDKFGNIISKFSPDRFKTVVTKLVAYFKRHAQWQHIYGIHEAFTKILDCRKDIVDESNKTIITLLIDSLTNINLTYIFEYAKILDHMILKQDLDFIEEKIAALVKDIKYGDKTKYCAIILGNLEHTFSKLNPNKVEKIIDELTDGLKDKDIKDKCAETLCYLRKIIPNLKPDKIEAVIFKLMDGLKDRYIDCSCAKALEGLNDVILKLNPAKIEKKILELVDGLKNKYDKYTYAHVLGSLDNIISPLNPDIIGEVIIELVNGVRSDDSSIRKESAIALDNFKNSITKLPKAKFEEAICKLVDNLKDSHEEVINTTATILYRLKDKIKDMSLVTIKKIVFELVKGIESDNKFIMEKSVELLCQFKEFLHQDEIGTIIVRLVENLKDSNETTKKTSAKMLGEFRSIINKMSTDKKKEVCTGLMDGLQDRNEIVRYKSAIILGELKNTISEIALGRIKEVVTTIQDRVASLINDLKSSSEIIRSIAAKILEELKHTISEMVPEKIEEVIFTLIDATKKADYKYKKELAQALNNFVDIVGTLNQPFIDKFIAELMKDAESEYGRSQFETVKIQEKIADITHILYANKIEKIIVATAPDRIKDIIAVLIEKIKDKYADFHERKKYEEALNNLCDMIGPEEKTFIDKLFLELINDLKSDNKYIREEIISIMYEFRKVIPKLDQEKIEEIIIGLVDNVKNISNDICLAITLSELKSAMSKMTPDKIQKLIDRLVVGLGDVFSNGLYMDILCSLSNELDKLDKKFIADVIIELIGRLNYEAKYGWHGSRGENTIELLGNFGHMVGMLNPDKIKELIVILIKGLQNKNVKQACIKTIGELGNVIEKLEQDLLQEMLAGLGASLKDDNQDIIQEAVKALDKIKNEISELTQDEIKKVIITLLNGLTKEDSATKYACIYMLENLDNALNKLSSDFLQQIILGLEPGLKSGDKEVKQKAVVVRDKICNALSKQSQSQINAMINELMQGLENSNPDIRQNSEKILGNIGNVIEKLDKDFIQAKIIELMEGLKNDNREFRDICARTLGNLGNVINKLGKDFIEEIISKLINGLKNGTSDIRQSSAKTLGNLGVIINKLNPARMKEIITNLTKCLKENNLASKEFATALNNFTQKQTMAAWINSSLDIPLEETLDTLLQDQSTDEKEITEESPEPETKTGQLLSSQEDNLQESEEQSEEQTSTEFSKAKGWALQYASKVEDKDSFYQAVAAQMKIINHPLLAQIPAGTLPEDNLRSAIQETKAADDDCTVDELGLAAAKQLKSPIAIININAPEQGFCCYYLDEEGEAKKTYDSKVMAENNKGNNPIIRLAHTENDCYLSVLSHPWLKNGAILSPMQDAMKQALYYAQRPRHSHSFFDKRLEELHKKSIAEVTTDRYPRETALI